MFTSAQQPLYRSALKLAWLAHCARTGVNPDFDGLMEEWKRALLVRSIGLPSSKFANHVEHFDRVMLELAIETGNKHEIEHWTEACERRMRFLIQNRCVQLTSLEGCNVDWSYCRSIYSHMGLPLTIEKAPAELLWKVFQALDTHVRRLKRRMAKEHAA